MDSLEAGANSGGVTGGPMRARAGPGAGPVRRGGRMGRRAGRAWLRPAGGSQEGRACVQVTAPETA